MKALSRAEVMAIGGYNNFLRTKLPPEHRIFDPDEETPDSAMATFLTAFPRGFAIEVLDVYSGPPRIAFKFRHWGYMEGPFKGHPPHGQRVEFVGVCIFHVSCNYNIDLSAVERCLCILDRCCSCSMFRRNETRASTEFIFPCKMLRCLIG